MADKKIICTVITDPNYDQRMQRICSALANDGYEVTLIGRKLPHSVPLSTQPYSQKRLNLWFNKGFLFYAEYNIRLFFYLLFQSFDLVCSIDLDSILPGFFVSKLRRKIFVHDAHELFSEMPELDDRPFVKRVWRNIEKFVFNRISHAYTESYGYKEIYEKNYPKLTFNVVRNVPFYYSTSRTPEQGEYLLYQGALNVGRGIEQIISAIKDMDVQLLLAGEGDMSQQLRKQVQELGIEDKVHFLGWVKPKELREITRNAKIGLNLLDPSNRHYRLSFPNKLFDYIMAELPQISMNFPYYQQIVENKTIGILIDDWDEVSIQQAIHKLLTDNEYYIDCIAGCRELKEIHNWEKEQKILLSIYEKIFAETAKKS